MSSLAHENGQMNWEDINWEKSYDEWKAYSQSKLANVLHGVELAKRLENTGISVYSLHPGGCGTQVCLFTLKCLQLHNFGSFLPL